MVRLDQKSDEVPIELLLPRKKLLKDNTKTRSSYLAYKRLLNFQWKM